MCRDSDDYLVMLQTRDVSWMLMLCSLVAEAAAGDIACLNTTPSIFPSLPSAC